MTDSYTSRISRRQALTWIGAMTSSAALIGNVYPNAPAIIDLDKTPWPESIPDDIDIPGYGTDPQLNPPAPVPWSLRLSSEQLLQLAALAEAICPGADEAGVADVINEWVSAPYPQQSEDRATLTAGLAWLGKQSSQNGNRDPLQWLPMLDEAAQVPEEQRSAPGQFFHRLRWLVSGAYFTSPQGIQELGYQGNVPIKGHYPGPDKQAIEHLEKLLDSLDLELPSQSLKKS